MTNRCETKERNMELLPEEMEQESIELLPPRQAMCGYRPCGGGRELFVDVNVDVNVFVALETG
jgi:hypothetical protein